MRRRGSVATLGVGRIEPDVGIRDLRVGVHGLVYERLGHDADELLDVDHPVIESRDLAACRYLLF